MTRYHRCAIALFFTAFAALPLVAGAQEPIFCGGVTGGLCTTQENEYTIGDISGVCVNIGPVNGGTNGSGDVIDCEYATCTNSGVTSGDTCNIAGNAGTCRQVCDLDATRCNQDRDELICIVDLTPGDDDDAETGKDQGGGCATSASGVDSAGLLMGLLGVFLWRRRR